MTVFRRLGGLKDVEAFASTCQEAKAALPIDPVVEPTGPLSTSFDVAGRRVGNRFAILPMEGWDGTELGQPTDLTRRRWERFGHGGAKLIWGGEAFAVRHDGRANPNQLVINDTNLAAIADLREHLMRAHAERHGSTTDLLVGMQLTHSGRWSRPNRKDRLEPLLAYHHPLLDARHADQPGHLLSDDALDRLVDDFVRAGELAYKAGFDFVDIKHCHGYLGHELLSAIGRPGRYGGSLENRARFVVSVANGLRANVPNMLLGTRLSIYDSVPYRKGPSGTGMPEDHSTASYGLAFGGDGTGTGFDLEEPAAWRRLARDAGISMVCTTAGSPYYSPHLQRPAAAPPSDGYLPPEDPLVGVARQIEATGWLKARVAGLAWVGSAYSYLQEWLGVVGQAAVRHGLVDSVGLGRMALSYPDMPADLLAGKQLERQRICRTFSDCTSAPRRGLVSGCYPLDPLYRDRPEALELRQARQRQGG